MSLIDPLVNLQRHKVFIWTGKRDDLIPYDVAEKNYDLYSEFISNKNQISLTVDPVATHQFPSDNFGAPCGAHSEPTYYIGNCNYSGAYESLKFILGEEIKKPGGEVKLSSLQLFNQSELYLNGKGNLNEIGMATLGFLYIPEACHTTKCLLHIHFHGCAEGIQKNGSYERAQNYVLNNGFLQMAEMNNIVTIFPQTMEMIKNNNGCWDFFSYNSPLFATKWGDQIKVVRSMIDRVVADKVVGEIGGSTRLFCMTWSNILIILLMAIKL